MNQEMFGTLPDGTLYTKRRNLWTRPKENVVTYKGFECEKWSCGIGSVHSPRIDMLHLVGPVGRETHFTISYDYIFDLRSKGTTNVMKHIYCEGYNLAGTWFGVLYHAGNRELKPCTDWTHVNATMSFGVDKGNIKDLSIYPAYLRDIDADLYIRNIMVTYGDEDYPYTPAPEIDETVVLT